ncbi:hypothetical protein HC081234_01430 [Helicobacter cinaedi]|nr:hypothetical protein HC081234_01430 [Helicobacter cinaedi]
MWQTIRKVAVALRLRHTLKLTKIKSREMQTYKSVIGWKKSVFALLAK